MEKVNTIPCKKCGYPCDNSSECRNCGTFNEDESNPLPKEKVYLLVKQYFGQGDENDEIAGVYKEPPPLPDYFQHTCNCCGHSWRIEEWEVK